MAAHELVIRSGTVVDGTGGAPRTADVAVDGGRITAVGRIEGRGRRELDADGLLVAPGWVDVHTHYDGQATWDTELAPSLWHGVTTVVMGNCGVGFAPVRPDRHAWLIELMEGVEDIPGTALHEGISWGWESFPEYLDVLDARAYTMDLAAQVPHAAVRGYVMGDRGADHTEVPTAVEIEAMGRIVAEAVRAGALGFSTSRTVNHRSADGRHTPSLTAGADELLGIAAAMGATGLGVFEVVADLVDVDDEFALLRAMVEASGRPMSITTLQNASRPDQHRRLLELIGAAATAGLPVRGQVAARPVGLIMSLDGRVHPFVSSPAFHEVAGLPAADRARALADPERRARLLAEAAPMGWGWDGTYPLGDRPDYDPGPTGSLAALGATHPDGPAGVALDLLLAAEGTGCLYVPVMNYADRDLRAVREMLVDPHTVPGLGDAGAHCTMICDGSFPTHLAAYWSRDAAPQDRLPFEWVVARQARATAELVGLRDRGLLAPGHRADINLVDHAALGIGRPEMLHDLPAGGKRLVQRATGYVATLVAGEETVVAGEATGARPGRLVRGAQAGPA
jgi:N-acyl-D-aspartate/D-glutamate deacylase